MSSIATASSANARLFALIDQLSQVVADGAQAQTEFVKKVATIAATQSASGTPATLSATAALDTVV